MDPRAITLDDVTQMLGQLRLVFSEPRERKEGPVADVWYRLLKDCDRGALLCATETYLRDGKHWPRPSEILSLVRTTVDRRGPRRTLTRTQQYAAWQQTGLSDGTPCPVCDSCMEWPADQGRVRLTHDDQRHREAGIGYTNVGPTSTCARAPA